jgi:post-segregation antitoxin (ccd killing protein)
MKKRTTLLIDAEILQTAQELGFNISKVCENCLKMYIEAIKNANKKIVPESSSPTMQN